MFARLPCLLAASILLGWCVPASAWNPETRVRMIDDAVKLMPASLRSALDSHREALLRATLTPLTREDDAGHRPEWAGGTLDATLAAEARALVQSIETPGTRFDEIVRHFGIVAHYVMDAGFPPGMTDSDGDRRYNHFAGFCLAKAKKFPLVFYGHDDEALSRGDYAAFALALSTRSRDDDRELARAYAAAGEPPDPTAFDDRSVPFAVGSLAYSRSVTHVVRIWLTAWAGAGGDTGKTPYLERRKKRSKTQDKQSGR